ncbi:substrate-binding domain-containing protein [Noviherbaspirillum massiliense]|uniref:helix-turn-helix transcriptional regulator n=1 Tax=Noviherbaspirillum massiliense TaxID=1465823 RepID=UPI0002F13AB7|nr:substrate-binding domain-containing protein [Noviherbaspirillum massiliense]
MFKITIDPRWEIAREAQPWLDTTFLLRLLLSIQETGSIAQAANEVGLSYRYAWGLLRDGEKLFGHALMHTERGRGTRLTTLAEKLIWADRRVKARLTPMLESLASEVENELEKVFGEKPAAIRLDASHGFAVAALLNHMDGNGLPVNLRYRNCTDAVAALWQHECDLAGFHVPIGKFERAAVDWYAKWLDPRTHCLLHLTTRKQGLIVAPGNPKNIVDLRDLVRSDVRFVNRQAGSGTRMLLELMLTKQKIPSGQINGFESAEFTHSAVAAYIASDMADVGIGVQAAAQRFKLDFVPLLQERYFFALTTSSIENPLMQKLIGIMRSPAFQSSVNGLAGYDATGAGTLLSLDEAFATLSTPQ